jgi:cysteine synthase B
MIEVAEVMILKEFPILSRIGQTPLLRLGKIAQALNPAVRIYAKAEWYNPGGSVKDRPALSMILQGLKSGLLTKDKIIIDATSGNTGIAYAMIGAVLGLHVHLAMPRNATFMRKQILHAYGATVSYTDPLEGTDGAQEYVRRIVSERPERYFYADQYNNPANWQSHYEGTAQEIFDQTNGGITHFVAGLGTTGTFVGTSRRLKELKPIVKCIAFQPDEPLHGLEGLKHLSSAKVPGIYDSTLADEMLTIATEEAYEMVMRLAREEGILVGPSSGAAVVASLRVVRTLEAGVVVTILSDQWTRYLNENLWKGRVTP